MKKKKSKPAKSAASIPRPEPASLKHSGETEDSLNRPDSRVRHSDKSTLNKGRKCLPSLKEISLADDFVVQLRNGKFRNTYVHNVRVRNPTHRESKSRSPNLGRVMREYPLRKINDQGSLLRKVLSLTKTKSRHRKEILDNVQVLLRGTIFTSSFAVCSTIPYLRIAEGKIQICRTPSLGASRLLINQVLRCENNFPVERLRAICSGKLPIG